MSSSGPSNLPDQPVFTVKQAARILGKHRRTLYRWRDIGVLPMTRIGGQYIITRDNLIAVMERGGSEPPGERSNVTQLHPRGAQALQSARWGDTAWG